MNDVDWRIINSYLLRGITYVCMYQITTHELHKWSQPLLLCEILV